MGIFDMGDVRVKRSGVRLRVKRRGLVRKGAEGPVGYTVTEDEIGAWKTIIAAAECRECGGSGSAGEQMPLMSDTRCSRRPINTLCGCSILRPTFFFFWLGEGGEMRHAP